ncbi:MAG TPA: hypothetical protein VFR84_13635 [Candidatus Angelobacter sp.]|nr:hypothetical protein [Candidatus Angelobacter sp.]
MNKHVQEQLRQEIEPGPLAYLMVFWTGRFAKENKLGVLTFDPETKQQKLGMAGFDKVQKSAISNYLQRLMKR